MPFQPFGYRFELSSPSEPENVKATIRARKKSWFDTKNGARGWIVGPFMCLWFSAFDQYGPMLFAWVRGDRMGTKISGRAGSDLNGLLLLALLWPLLVFFLYEMIVSGLRTADQLLPVGAIVLLSPLALWAAHKDRKEAEPLVRFVRDCVEPKRRARRLPNGKVRANLTMTVGEQLRTGPVTPDAIHDAMLDIGAGDFLVLESDPETYIQTATADGQSFVLETRKGDSSQHFRAVRKDRRRAAADGSNALFLFDEVFDALLAYASGGSMPDVFAWEQMRLEQ